MDFSPANEPDSNITRAQQLTLSEKAIDSSQKLKKLMDIFLNQKQLTPAFQDTFVDQEVFLNIKKEENYALLCEHLLSFILHSSNK